MSDEYEPIKKQHGQCHVPDDMDLLLVDSDMPCVSQNGTIGDKGVDMGNDTGHQHINVCILHILVSNTGRGFPFPH